MLSKLDIQKINTLIEAGEFINSGSGDSSPPLRVLESAVKLCGGSGADLFLVNRETRELYREVSLGEGKTARRALKAGEKAAAWTLLHKRPLLTGGTALDPSRAESGDALKSLSGDLLAAPMLAGGGCLGVILLRGGEFSGEDLKWLELFAAQAGIALLLAGGIENPRAWINLPGLRRMESRADYITAESPIMKEKLEIAERAAKTDSPVLISGERGVGKRFFAEWIHRKSRRGGKPFIAVNCAAMPESSLESGFSSREEGVFPEAEKEYACFELAGGGTVFLEDADELTPELQAKLLSLFQKQALEKAGAGRAADPRILASTSASMEERVEKGEYSGDLYYRLNVFPLYIPPLRQRPEDIPALADFFLRNSSREMKKSFEGFSAEAAESLLSYAWPGNVRELETCIERACILGKGGRIEAGDLFLRAADSLAAYGGADGKLKAAENVFRARFIRRVLEEHNWNQTETAKVLDIQRTYLSRLIKELNISTSKEQRK